jgi:hypothetical protein
MMTKQNDTVAMTEEQLDTVAGGSGYVKIGDIKGEHVQDGVLRLDKSSTRMRFRGCVPTDPCAA